MHAVVTLGFSTSTVVTEGIDQMAILNFGVINGELGTSVELEVFTVDASAEGDS